MNSAYESLDEFFTDIENYYGGYGAYRDRFVCQYTPENRVIDLAAFDKLLANEHRVTRQHAEWVTRRRELGDIHNSLLRSGR
jgi:hypothetical protein